MRLPLVLLVLTGCATAATAKPTSAPAATSDDATLVRALEQEQAGFDSELRHPGPAAPCERRCALGRQICDDSGRICAIANRDPDDSALGQACSEAADRCAEADIGVKADGCACAAER